VKKDQAINVRVNAINSLHAIGGAKAISCMVPALDDGEDSVVDAAVENLIDLSKKEKRVSGSLLRYLKQAESRNKVLLTLSRIAIIETNPKIQKKICRELTFQKNERDKSVLLEIAVALRSYDLSLSNEIMRELSNDTDKMIRENARAILSDWEIEL
jgi:HEAT repeat protein